MNPERKWAVTGATGFIGRHLVKRIFQFPNVRLALFDREKHSLMEPESLKSFVTNQEVIFHLAGLTRGVKEVLETNTLGTLSLLEAVRKYGQKGAKIVFPSSFAVFKIHYEPITLKEDSSEEPGNIYGLSKLFTEQLIAFYTQQFAIKGIILRFSSVYGPGCPPFKQSLISTLATEIKEGGQVEIWGDGNQEKDLVYIDDAIEAFLQAVKFEPEGCEIFNICAGKGISVNEITAILEKLGKKKAKVKYLKEKTDEARQYWIGDNQKAREKLGWQPKTAIKRGLRTLFT